MAEGDTWVNALIGGIVTVVTSGFVPLAPILGGAVSGYLEGGDSDDGLRAGVYAGLIALVPFVLFVVFLSSFLGAIGFGFGMMGPGMFGIGGGLTVMFVLVALVFGLFYVVALSAVGGWIGNYVKYDTDIEV